MVCIAMNENEHRFFTIIQNLNQRKVKRHVSSLFEERTKTLSNFMSLSKYYINFPIKDTKHLQLIITFQIHGLFGEYNKHKLSLKAFKFPETLDSSILCAYV